MVRTFEGNSITLNTLNPFTLISPSFPVLKSHCLYNRKKWQPNSWTPRQSPSMENTRNRQRPIRPRASQHSQCWWTTHSLCSRLLLTSHFSRPFLLNLLPPSETMFRWILLSIFVSEVWHPFQAQVYVTGRLMIGHFFQLAIPQLCCFKYNEGGDGWKGEQETWWQHLSAHLCRHV